MRIRAFAPRSDRRGVRKSVPACRPGAAGDDGSRRADRRASRENAAEIHVLLSEAAHGPCVQLAEVTLRSARASHIQWVPDFVRRSTDVQSEIRPASGWRPDAER